MFGVVLTIWLLVQLPVGLVLGRLIGCPQKQRASRCIAPSRPALPPRARAA